MTPNVVPLDPVLLRPADLVNMLRLSRSQVYQLLASNTIPHLRVGRLIRIRRQDLDAWLERNQGAA